MKQTLTEAWAKLRKSERDVLLGAVTGLFLGLSVLTHSTLQGHFLQRMNLEPTAKTMIRTSEPALREKSDERRAKRLLRQKRAVVPGKKTAIGITDTKVITTNLRPAAPKAPASEPAARHVILTQADADDEASSSTSSSSTSPAASSSSQSSQPAISDFPPLTRTVHPVSKVPNWGAMRTPSEWNRSYREMTGDDFVAVPSYNMSLLTIPLSALTNPIKAENIPTLTAKLYYSTRYMGKYDIDAGEHSGTHDGVDLKLAIGTPIGAIGGGRVYAVREDAVLGLHVLIEHRAGGEYYLSIYGHLGSASVTAGQDVTPGQTIGTVGMTGNTSGPHLHLSVHSSKHQGTWNAYASGESMHPIAFIAAYRGGE
jgi:murein DD-endopeptidase MepM/ murein hydrolase activator NlpD